VIQVEPETATTLGKVNTLFLSFFGFFGVFGFLVFVFFGFGFLIFFPGLEISGFCCPEAGVGSKNG